MGPLSVVRIRAPRLPVLAAAACLLAACSAPGAPPVGDQASPEEPAADEGSGADSRRHPPRELTGSLPNGTTWKAVVPESWSGTLLLYGHGYIPSFVPGPPVAQVAPDGATQQALLDRGYALAGSSYSQNGWAMGTAAQDQLDTLDAVVDALDQPPRRVLAYGSSMGGLVTGQLVERATEVVDGALPTCGLMGGGVGLVDYQLDGAHAIDQLLAPDAQLDLVGYASPAEANAAVAAFTAAVDAGQRTPEGRARISLAAALFHLPHWRSGQPQPEPGDIEARHRAQHAWMRDTLAFVLPGRFDIESEAGGNPSTNLGVDYRQLFLQSADRYQVVAMYQIAGLDLGADLEQLTRTAATAADPAARAWQEETSTVSGEIGMPVLSMHTTSDNLAPVQYEEEYREDVKGAGARSLLRQVYVARPNHCNFTPAELVASILALDQRVESGQWGNLAHPQQLDAAAEQLGLGASEIVRFHPGEFLADDR